MMLFLYHRLLYRNFDSTEHAAYAYFVVDTLTGKGLELYGIGTDELTIFATLKESLLTSVLAEVQAVTLYQDRIAYQRFTLFKHFVYRINGRRYFCLLASRQGKQPCDQYKKNLFHKC